VTPHEEPAEAPRLDDAWSATGPECNDRAAIGPANDWFAGDAVEQSPGVEPVNEEPVAGSDDVWPVVEPVTPVVEYADGAEVAEATSEVEGAPDAPDSERPEFDVTRADSPLPEADVGAVSAREAADAVAPAEASGTTPELPTEAPGEEPRVLELRRQLTELFGVPAEYQPPPPADPEDLAAYSDVTADRAEFAAPPEGDHVAARGVGADVVSLLDTWRARLNAELQTEEGGSPSPSEESSLPDDVTADAFVLTPLTPETRLARSAAFELPSRVDKSAVRQEISSLRAVANTHARAVVARLSTEKRARQVWLISGTCMVPLFSGGTFLLSSMPPGLMRWLGWLMLTGGAAAFSVCLNSFNRLSKLHEEQEALLPEGSAAGDTLKDTAEISIPAELAAEAPTPALPSADEAAQPQQPASDDAPVESEPLAASV
jgi:hypothetical protein